MRISDWSSDVCSSDLAQRAPAHRRIFLLRAALDVHIGQRLVAADVDGAEDHRPVARRVEHVAIEPLLAVARRQGRRDEKLEFGAEEPDAARPGQIERGDIFARSEEHTSELQSLMRISYAVFCLKKKN